MAGRAWGASIRGDPAVAVRGAAYETLLLNQLFPHGASPKPSGLATAVIVAALPAGGKKRAPVGLFCHGENHRSSEMGGTGALARGVYHCARTAGRGPTGSPPPLLNWSSFGKDDQYAKLGNYGFLLCSAIGRHCDGRLKSASRTFTREKMPQYQNYLDQRRGTRNPMRPQPQEKLGHGFSHQNERCGTQKAGRSLSEEAPPRQPETARGLRPSMPTCGAARPTPVLSQQAEHSGDLLEADREISPTDRAEHRVRGGQNLHSRSTARPASEFSECAKERPPGIGRPGGIIVTGGYVDSGFLGGSGFGACQNSLTAFCNRSICCL